VTTIVVLIVAGIAIWFLFAYNRLVRLRNQVRTAWADIDVQLTRRHDLVPPLVAAVKGCASHEQAVLQAVTELRSQGVALHTPARLGEVETALEQALARLFALKEAYPDLKANESFAQLQRDLVKVEEHLQYARRFYNGAVRDYNDTRAALAGCCHRPRLRLRRKRVLPGTRRGTSGGARRDGPMMRLYWVLALLIAAVAGAHADERILTYDVDIAVEANGSLLVTETITVRAEGNQIRRGIYRDFPTRYRDRYDNRVAVGLEVSRAQRRDRTLVHGAGGERRAHQYRKR
jgi:LemA protein